MANLREKMDKFREKYIALQKAFWDSDGGAASVAALYEFKDELEKCGEKEAKLVLVDVYELLGLKKECLRATRQNLRSEGQKAAQKARLSEAVCGKRRRGRDKTP